jgi:hypothetical protein
VVDCKKNCIAIYVGLLRSINDSWVLRRSVLYK